MNLLSYSYLQLLIPKTPTLCHIAFTQTASSVLVTMSVAITFPMVYYFIAGSAVGSAGTSPASLNTYSNLHSLSIAPNRLETILRISRGVCFIPFVIQSIT